VIRVCDMKMILMLLSALVVMLSHVVPCPAADPAPRNNVPGSDASSAYMSPLEREVLQEINNARKNPKVYAEYLEEMRRYYRGKRYERPGRTTILTREGMPALEEAVKFLGSATGIASLSPSRGMSLGARDLVNDQKRSGAVGHAGSDGSNPGSRVNKYGQWQRTIGENIEYGGENGREVVINMIVDDGVPGRGHRRNLFDPEFGVAGIACDTHPVYRRMCTVTFAGEYVEKK
jgi:hypothetical protein